MTLNGVMTADARYLCGSSTSCSLLLLFVCLRLILFYYIYFMLLEAEPATYVPNAEMKPFLAFLGRFRFYCFIYFGMCGDSK